MVEVLNWPFFGTAPTLTLLAKLSYIGLAFPRKAAAAIA
jgi:hypothetical protein